MSFLLKHFTDATNAFPLQFSLNAEYFGFKFTSYILCPNQYALCRILECNVIAQTYCATLFMLMTILDFSQKCKYSIFNYAIFLRIANLWWAKFEL